MTTAALRRALIVALLAAVVAALTTVSPSAQAKPELALKAAMDKEVVDGDLKAAIEMYRKLADGPDAAVAAKALVRMGQCYEKLGAAQTTEARKAYERVLARFGDQKDAADQARAQLARLAAPAGSPTVPGGLSYRRVWTAPDNVTLERVSPDGRYAGYVRWNADGMRSTIVLHDLVTGADRIPTKVDEADVEGMAFSRDGRQLAYVWWGSEAKRGEMRVVSLTGTGTPEPRRLLAADDIKWPQPLDWTPDGRWIAAWIDRTDGRKQLALVSVADGSVRVLRPTGPVEMGHVAFSPDSKYLAFDVPDPRTTARDIVIVETEGLREVSSVVHRADDMLVGWAPDGSHVIFASDRAGANALWAQRFLNGKLDGQPELVKPDVGRFEPMGVSASGAVYSSVDTNVSPWEMRSGTFNFSTGQWDSAPADLTPYLVGSSLSLMGDPSPDWSADGKSIAYVARSTPYLVSAKPVIVISTTAGKDIRQIRPRLASLGGTMGWAPDGESLISGGRDLDGRWGIFRIDAQTGDASLVSTSDTSGLSFVWGRSQDRRTLYYSHSLSSLKESAYIKKDLVTGQETELVRGASGVLVGVSPDGQTVYCRRPIQSEGNQPSKDVTLVERDVKSGRERELLGRRLTGPMSLSPDGRFVAAVSNDTTTASTSVLLIPVAGGEPRELMRWSLAAAAKTGAPPSGICWWAPDSQSVWLKRPPEGGMPGPWFWVPLDGREPRRIDFGAAGELNGARAHPDGRQVAFTLVSSRPFKPSEVWVLENSMPAAPAAGKK